MHHRAGRAATARAGPRVPRETMNLARAVYALTIWVLVIGHARDRGRSARRRRRRPAGSAGPSATSRASTAISVDVLVVLTLVLVVALVRARAPRRVLERRVADRRRHGRAGRARLRAVLQPDPARCSSASTCSARCASSCACSSSLLELCVADDAGRAGERDRRDADVAVVR